MSRSADSRLASDRRVFRRVHKYRGDGIDMSAWPATVPAVAQLIDAGLDLTAGITVLSPIVAAVPGARILELGEWGIRPASWNQLELVAEWREFLREPQSFIRHLLDDEKNCGSFSD